MAFGCMLPPVGRWVFFENSALCQAGTPRPGHNRRRSATPVLHRSFQWKVCNGRSHGDLQISNGLFRINRHRPDHHLCDRFCVGGRRNASRRSVWWGGNLVFAREIRADHKDRPCERKIADETDPVIFAIFITPAPSPICAAMPVFRLIARFSGAILPDN